MHALIIDGQIEAVGTLPASARRLDTDDWVMGLDTAPPELVAATGWLEVDDTPRPDDTATTTHDRSVELVDGTPTVVWTERDKTADELAAAQQAENYSVVDQAITDAIAELDTLAKYPAMPTVPDSTLPAIPAGTLTTAVLSDAVRVLRAECLTLRQVIVALRNESQANRAGAQRVAQTLADKIRLDRGDFDHLA